MLRMTRVTGECCGFGQDQLAYSLEFTVLQPLMDAALAATETGQASRTIVVPDSTSWLFLDPPAAGQREFAYRGRTQVKPVVLEHSQVVRGGLHHAAAFYLALPYGDNARAMREMAAVYELRDERRFERNGYAIRLYRMVPRGTAAQ
jgi:hypothetical protein